MKLKTCKRCQQKFPYRFVTDDGKTHTVNQRLFCFECSPFKTHNTKDITKYPKSETINGITYKTCRGCHKKLPYQEEFFYMKSEWGKSRALCKICSRKSKNTRNSALKQWAVDLLGGKCCICGYNKCLWALDFHHTDPTQKDFSISSKKMKSEIEKELKKCRLVCRNCHSEVHAGVTQISGALDRA